MNHQPLVNGPTLLSLKSVHFVGVATDSIAFIYVFYITLYMHPYICQLKSHRHFHWLTINNLLLTKIITMQRPCMTEVQLQQAMLTILFTPITQTLHNRFNLTWSTQNNTLLFSCSLILLITK